MNYGEEEICSMVGMKNELKVARFKEMNSLKMCVWLPWRSLTVTL